MDIKDTIKQYAVGYLPKWSQMVVTGRSVTVEQAKNIIFRTDSFLTDSNKYSGGNNKRFNDSYREKAGLNMFITAEDSFRTSEYLRKSIGFIETQYVTNDWASSAFVFGPHGWCSPSGVIAFNDNIGKNPRIEEVYADWVIIAKAFPFIDATVTLMSGESCEEDTDPVINFRVLDGNVTICRPSLRGHNWGALPERKNIPSGFGSLESEIGLPSTWYDEYATKVHTIVENVI